MTQQLCRFRYAALGSTSELSARIASERGARTVTLPGGQFTGSEIPAQRLLKFIKSQQKSASRETERMIQGIQGLTDRNTAGRNAAVDAVLSGFGEQDVQLTATDTEESMLDNGPTVSVRFGPSTSFLAAGRQLAKRFTLNRKQSVAFLLVCRQLDLVHSGESTHGQPAPQLCQFIDGEGGTGKSRVIEALVELFAGKEISNRLLVTGTLGTAAARINGITIYSACNFSKDASRMIASRDKGFDGIGTSNSSDRYVNGSARMDWQEKPAQVFISASHLKSTNPSASSNERMKSSPADGIPTAMRVRPSDDVPDGDTESGNDKTVDIDMGEVLGPDPAVEDRVDEILEHTGAGSLDGSMENTDDRSMDSTYSRERPHEDVPDEDAESGNDAAEDINMGEVLRPDSAVGGAVDEIPEHTGAGSLDGSTENTDDGSMDGTEESSTSA
ncbi:hypothetical protein AUP68_10476 [Ilyonectria robusta]